MVILLTCSFDDSKIFGYGTVRVGRRAVIDPWKLNIRGQNGLIRSLILGYQLYRVCEMPAVHRHWISTSKAV